MYQNPSAPLAAGIAGASSTGFFLSPLWAVLAGFAILAACTALARIVPRNEREPRHRR
ncbi:MAG TPA: hypothetical protein VGN48_05325 [Pedococcus sp.]|nr:hypothetical protein [Pedococcus sp.]